MEIIRVSELNDAVRAFLERALAGDGVVIEDEAGEVRCGVIPYRRPTAAQKRQGWEVLQRLQERTGRAMRAAGVTEDDIDQALEGSD